MLYMHTLLGSYNIFIFCLYKILVFWNVTVSTVHEIPSKRRGQTFIWLYHYNCFSARFGFKCKEYGAGKSEIYSETYFESSELFRVVTIVVIAYSGMQRNSAHDISGQRYPDVRYANSSSGRVIWRKSNAVQKSTSSCTGWDKTIYSVHQ